MTTLDEKICEQLSAWMDGELPADEARFLERRLANEPELRARWERMQLAASCLKGHSLRPMPATLASNVSAAIAEPVIVARPGRRWIGWAVAASVALVAVVVVPRWTGNAGAGPEIAQSQPGDPVPPVSLPVLVPTPSSADLVASRGDDTIATPTQTVPAPVVPRAATAPVMVASRSTAATGSQSPADFPLTAANGGKAWPRSPLDSDNDPALEAYLIRHNQMMGDDGLSGFVPYVDVVTNESQAADAGDEGEANR